MVEIDNLQEEIVENLKVLEPDKIILFGSYAKGSSREDSDIDICIVKNIPRKDARRFVTEARIKLRSLILKYKIGFDIVTAPENFINEREDYFYKIDILKNGKIIYAK